MVSGATATEVGRIASCASWAFLALVLNSRGLAGVVRAVALEDQRADPMSAS